MTKAALLNPEEPERPVLVGPVLDTAPGDSTARMTRAEVALIRQKAIYNGPVSRDEVLRLAESWLHLEQKGA